jgi:hypothetical protein
MLFPALLTLETDRRARAVAALLTMHREKRPSLAAGFRGALLEPL